MWRLVSGVRQMRKSKKRKPKDPLRHRLTAIGSTLRNTYKMKVTKEQIKERYMTTGLCTYCLLPLALDISIDHIQPRSREGPDAWDNIQFIHQACNLMKGNLTDKEFRALLEFLKAYPEMEKLIKTRLKLSGFAFGRRF
jgi:5-methylcytosine-specific restriction endonuclease McrA